MEVGASRPRPSSSVVGGLGRFLEEVMEVVLEVVRVVLACLKANLAGKAGKRPVSL